MSTEPPKLTDEARKRLVDIVYHIRYLTKEKDQIDWLFGYVLAIEEEIPHEEAMIIADAYLRNIRGGKVPGITERILNEFSRTWNLLFGR